MASPDAAAPEDTPCQPAAETLADGWHQYSDAQGHAYWYNHTTGASQYESPFPPSASMADTAESSSDGWGVYEDDQGRPYWFNRTTGESTYDQPAR